jgi:hypothetical protein
LLKRPRFSFVDEISECLVMESLLNIGPSLWQLGEFSPAALFCPLIMCEKLRRESSRSFTTEGTG